MERKYKTFNVKMPSELWLFLKMLSARREVPMNKIIQDCLEKLKEKNEKKMLTNKDADI